MVSSFFFFIRLTPLLNETFNYSHFVYDVCMLHDICINKKGCAVSYHDLHLGELNKLQSHKYR
jgi:hypothetical protein